MAPDATGIIITEWSEMSTAPLCFCHSTWDLLLRGCKARDGVLIRP